MTYYDQSLLSSNRDFAARISACVATQVQPNGTVWLGITPEAWTSLHQWEVAAAPGFAAAYASALAGGVENPGRDPAVIPDNDLLAAVQAVLAVPTPDPLGE